MKRILILLAAALAAFLLVEFIVGIIVGFPRYGVVEKVKMSDRNFELIFKPYSEYWNVEGGNKVFRRNNLGFTGSDVKVSDESKYILMLGNSTLAGQQIDPRMLSTTIFQEHLSQQNDEYQVVNLAAYGHSPYDLWIRIAYFEKIFKPAYVILVMQHTSDEDITAHKHPLDFSTKPDLGKKDLRKSTRIRNFLRNHSHFINVAAQGFLHYNAQKRRKIRKVNQSTQEKDDTAAFNDFCEVITQFKNKYKEKFIFVSINEDEDMNIGLQKYCLDQNIRFHYIPLYLEEYKIRGVGHLNPKGHQLLGDFLYEIFQEYTH